MVTLSGAGSLTTGGPRGLRMASAGATGSMTLDGSVQASVPAAATGSLTLGGGGVLIAGATATVIVGAAPGAVLIATATGTAELSGLSAEQAVRAVELAARALRIVDPDEPEAFRFHDLRHYLASLLIGSGLDVKVVQHRLRHGSAKTTLDTYGHLWPDSDESARAAVGAVPAAVGTGWGRTG
jgi:hypothetical protein